MARHSRPSSLRSGRTPWKRLTGTNRHRSRTVGGRANASRWSRRLRIGLLVLIPVAVIVTPFALRSDSPLRSDPGPSISRLSASTGPVEGGIEIVIIGSGFAKRPIVSFGNAPAKVLSVTEKRMVVGLPAREPGSVRVSVRTPEGSSRAGPSSRFTYVGPPTITKLTPDSGKAEGGVEVTITGTDFVDGTTVRFGKKPATDVAVTSPTTLTATVPERDFGTVNVHVTTPFGSSETSDKSEYRVGSDAELRLRVGSFNVRVASGYKKFRTSSLERPWTTRLPLVAGQIKREDLDVVGIQEASASGKYTRTGRSQYEDIVAALGAPYKLTNVQRYCAGKGAGARCSNGGSSSDRIIYNSDRLKLLSQGARKLDGRSSGAGSTRNVVWATFKDRRSDKKLMFVSTHLEPGKVNSVRVRQARIIVDEIAGQNPDGIPTVLVGDLGAGKLDSQGNGAHAVLTGAGFVDPLVNTRNYRGSDTRVGKLINTRYSSLNNFKSSPQTIGGFPIGSYLDYIMVRGGDFDLREWETVVDLDANGRFAGVIPSDHNLVKLTLGLP